MHRGTGAPAQNTYSKAEEDGATRRIEHVAVSVCALEVRVGVMIKGWAGLGLERWQRVARIGKGGQDPQGVARDGEE